MMMMITHKINQLAIEEVLATGVYDGEIRFEKFQPTMKVSHDDTNLQIKYNNARYCISDIQDGITDEQLLEAISKLEKIAIERVKQDFIDFRRYNTGGK